MVRCLPVSCEPFEVDKPFGSLTAQHLRVVPVSSYSPVDFVPSTLKNHIGFRAER
jgi:hypothetical protein